MPVFEGMVLRLPTQAEAEQGELEEIVVPYKSGIVAASQEAAIVKLSKMVPEDEDDTRLVVRVRPF